MTTYSGQDGVVTVDANTVAEVKSFSVEETGDTLEDTVQGDTWRTRVAGLKSWSGSMECLFDPSDTNGQGALTIGSSVSLVLYPFGNSSGDRSLTGTAIITGRSIGSELEGLVSASYSFEGSGALTEAAVV